MLTFTKMSWITPENILKLLDKEDRWVRGTELRERLERGMTPVAFNRHLRKLTTRGQIYRRERGNGYEYHSVKDHGDKR